MKALKVSKIKNGTVIDHIPAGRALDVLRLLGITGKEGFMILVAMNVSSSKLKGGKKDLVKIEGKYLTPREAETIALIAPTATINIIKDGEVVEKINVSIPDVIEGIVRCPNPTCISRKEDEPIKSKFRVINKSPLRLQCYYCETELEEEDLSKYVVG
ncbi:aspartate carbamoyltransferase [Ignicoccus pacificus DSM 13166]|uniref:Aspartate carbamoyltransferase regulatory chain n=1 Tax=Ignicoccus pacificus DSM 13166 TaxID=940294 RepID=A0A977KA78_9CREN|nr:aspartate carbamoyltransferase [Ignicoccus pacificus DSM 13166]